MRIKFSVAGKLWAAVGLLVVSMLGIVTFSGWRSASLQKEADAQMAVAAAKLKAAQEWARLSEVAVTRATATVISTDPNVGATFKDINAKTIARITELKKRIEAMPLTDADRALIGR